MTEYKSALERYASAQMKYVFSEQKKFTTWRQCWIALAEAQQEIGLEISSKQIKQMKDAIRAVNYSRVAELEQELRHDVMAHVLAYGEMCPEAKEKIHWGATSMFVCDNTELIQMKEGLEIITKKAAKVIGLLANFAEKYKELPCLGYTHYQPAQPVTVGKRAAMWANDLVEALYGLEHVYANLKARGIRGATGTNDSFLTILEGDREKLKKLQELVCQKLGFDKFYNVIGQTYPRIVDAQVLSALGVTAAASSKFGNDLRILMHEEEVEEPFGKTQVGSSAMPYKRNPMRSERIGALARHVIQLSKEPLTTAAEQWLERSLDDSAARRFYLPESFLGLDGILNIYSNIAEGLVVNQKIIEKNLMEKLPFMATEQLLMKAVKRGGDRQEIHRLIKEQTHFVVDKKKRTGIETDILKLIKYSLGRKHPSELAQFLKDSDFKGILEPKKYIGDCVEQVEEFNSKIVKPILEKYEPNLGRVDDLKV